MKSLKPFFSTKSARVTLTLACMLFVSSCSLYQSRGRKLLQSGEGYTYPASFAAVPYLESCGPIDQTKAWQTLQGQDDLQKDASEHQLALFEAQDQETYLIQISDLQLSRSCQFHFANELERNNLLEGALELTQLHFSLGEFAFSHNIPLK